MLAIAQVAEARNNLTGNKAEGKHGSLAAHQLHSLVHSLQAQLRSSPATATTTESLSHVVYSVVQIQSEIQIHVLLSVQLHQSPYQYVPVVVSS